MGINNYDNGNIIHVKHCLYLSHTNIFLTIIVLVLFVDVMDTHSQFECVDRFPYFSYIQNFFIRLCSHSFVIVRFVNKFANWIPMHKFFFCFRQAIKNNGPRVGPRTRAQATGREGDQCVCVCSHGLCQVRMFCSRLREISGHVHVSDENLQVSYTLCTLMGQLLSLSPVHSVALLFTAFVWKTLVPLPSPIDVSWSN